MQLKYFGSKAWLAPHLDRLLGDVAVLHSPFFGSGKLEYYLAARRPGLEVRGVDAFEPDGGCWRRRTLLSASNRCCAKEPHFPEKLLRSRTYAQAARRPARPLSAPGRRCPE